MTKHQQLTAGEAQEDQRHAQKFLECCSRTVLYNATAQVELHNQLQGPRCENTAQTCLGYSTDLKPACTPSSSFDHVTLTSHREHSVLRHDSFQRDCVGSRPRFVRHRKQSPIIALLHTFHNHFGSDSVLTSGVRRRSWMLSSESILPSLDSHLPLFLPRKEGRVERRTPKGGKRNRQRKNESQHRDGSQQSEDAKMKVDMSVPSFILIVLPDTLTNQFRTCTPKSRRSLRKLWSSHSPDRGPSSKKKNSLEVLSHRVDASRSACCCSIRTFAIVVSADLRGTPPPFDPPEIALFTHDALIFHRDPLLLLLGHVGRSVAGANAQRETTVSRLASHETAPTTCRNAVRVVNSMAHSHPTAPPAMRRREKWH